MRSATGRLCRLPDGGYALSGLRRSARRPGKRSAAGRSCRLPDGGYALSGLQLLKPVGPVSAAPPGVRADCRMAAAPYPAYRLLSP